jgi:hypothetical protein
MEAIREAKRQCVAPPAPTAAATNNLLVKCMNCTRQISCLRFAAHLHKCLSVGGSKTR